MDIENTDNQEIFRLSTFDIGVAIEITSDVLLSKISGVIVDVKSDTIIIKPKAIDDFHEKIPKGTVITVRCIIGESVFRFISVLKDVVFKPTMLALIEVPELIRKEERRDKRRINCKLPCVLVIKENKIKACVQDLTPTGCRCSLYESGMLDKWSAKFLIEEDCAVEIFLPVGGTKKELSVKGMVKYLSTAYDRFDIGIEFHMSVEEEKQMIETILKRGW
ncbi:MAG: PilZ domain-containing protein [Nitrospirae bacterium]|nr:PilZ domain-containing protein [Nitrospirota bacterium]